MTRVYKILLVCGLSLCGCSEPRPPKGFEAVQPVSLNASGYVCPDLIGAYDLASAYSQNPLVANWLGHQDPRMTSLIVDELVDTNVYNYRVQMDLQEFLALAEQLRLNNPADYYDWRKGILELQSSERGTSRIANENSISALGPLLQVRGQTRGYSCKDGWMKVLEVERSVEGEEGRYTRQWDLWVGRDEEGNLLLRTIVYRLKPGWTFWAAGGAGVRLIRERYEWHKVPELLNQPEAKTLTAQDLPPVAPPNRSPDCVKDVNAFIAYNQSLTQDLPPDLALTKFIPVEAAPDGPCNRQGLIVGFSSGRGGAMESVLVSIKQDARVENFVVKVASIDGYRHHHVLVEYTLRLE